MDIVTYIAELLNNANDKERQEIANMLSNINVNNRNNDNIQKFTEQILNKENKKINRYVKFLESSSINGLITAPTQVGKSNATREFIETCFKARVPVIVSTDNKTDQCEQLYSRIEKDLSGADVTMMKVSDKSFNETFKKCIKEDNHRFVVFCLDNSTQIEKLIMNLTSCVTRYQTEIKKFSKIAIIHDEADQITKDRDIDSINEEQAESHKKWLELINLINKNMGHMDLKRVFVTATPENCCMLYKIDSPDVIKLEIPATYVGYKNLKYYELEDDLEIKEILEKEVNRIKKDNSYEAILYCIERKITDGHEKILNSLTSYLNCTINTYNGNGITTIMRTPELSKQFEKLLKTTNISFKKNNKFFVIKNITIRKFYSICKNMGENCVITIGKDLISRGISYVSEDTHEPLTATTMIYKPGMTMHAVGICQTIGRITGCAMPSLKRRLYAPKDVIETYITYNKNQEAYIKKMESEVKLTKEIIDEMIFEKFSRHIDRIKLKLKMNMEKISDNLESERMKHLINIWWNADTLIGKILKFVYENEIGVSEHELKTFIKKCGSENVDELFNELIRQKRGHAYVFERTSNKITKLRKEASDYIKQLK